MADVRVTVCAVYARAALFLAPFALTGLGMSESRDAGWAGGGYCASARSIPALARQHRSSYASAMAAPSAPPAGEATDWDFKLSLDWDFLSGHWDGRPVERAEAIARRKKVFSTWPCNELTPSLERCLMAVERASTAFAPGFIEWARDHAIPVHNRGVWAAAGGKVKL